MLVDIDETVLGRIDDRGAVAFTEETVVFIYGLRDEITTRVMTAGDRVIGVRQADLPRLAVFTVLLRYSA